MGTTADFQRVTYEQFQEAMQRRDAMACDLLDWSGRLQRFPAARKVLLQSYIHLFDHRQPIQAMTETLQEPELQEEAAAMALSHQLPLFDAFCTTKLLEGLVMSTHPGALVAVEELYSRWQDLQRRIPANEPVLRSLSLLVYRSMTLFYTQQENLARANNFYRLLLDGVLNSQNDARCQSIFAEACRDLAYLLGLQGEQRLLRYLLEDLHEVMDTLGPTPPLRIALVRVVYSWVWSHKEGKSLGRITEAVQTAEALQKAYPQDKGLRREVAQLWVALTYWWGAKRQWREALTYYRRLYAWMKQYPNDRLLRLRWMQVARNVIWGHDGHLGLGTMEAVFDTMVQVLQQYPKHSALQEEVGWSCVNLSWSYGVAHKTERMARTVTVVRRLLKQHPQNTEMAECFAATFRNWLWALRDIPATESQQATLVEEMRQLLMRYRHVPYIRKQVVACLVNYATVAKRRYDACVLIEDLELLQRLWMEYPNEEQLAEAVAEIASNLISAYEKAKSAEEPKVYLGLICGLLTDRPNDPLILGSLGSAVSDLAWLCERLEDRAGTEHCYRLMDSYAERHPENETLQQALVSTAMAWEAALAADNDLQAAYEVHLKIRYLAKQNREKPFFVSAWARSAERLVTQHKHHEPSFILPLVVAELNDVYARHATDPAVAESWMAVRLHVLWRCLANNDLDGIPKAIQAIWQAVHAQDTDSRIILYGFRAEAVRVHYALQKNRLKEATLIQQNLLALCRKHPQWLSSLEILSQSATVVLRALWKQGRVRQADDLMRQHIRFFRTQRQVYVNPLDATHAWDQLARLSFFWMVWFGSVDSRQGMEGLWRRPLNQELARLSRDVHSQSLLWRWVPQAQGVDEAFERDGATFPVDNPEQAQALDVVATRLLQSLWEQFPHDRVVAVAYEDWLRLLYHEAISADNDHSSAGETLIVLNTLRQRHKTSRSS